MSPLQVQSQFYVVQGLIVCFRVVVAIRSCTWNLCALQAEALGEILY